MKKFINSFLFILLSAYFVFGQNLSEQFGKMYSFHNIPYDKINSAYGVNLSENWYSEVMKGALQLGNGCSASFVSLDGLIMTNHHCVRDLALQVQKNDEDFLANGFYASNLNEERKIPNLFADQLIKIENITDKIITDDLRFLGDTEKSNIIRTRIDSIENYFSAKSKLICKVISLYGGAKYILHYYKRYNDIRLVMLPEFQIASTGWDWDNFTYPRYELDFAFLRAYDEFNTPVKSTDMFKFNLNGAGEGELTFVIGRPGNTDRLYTSYQLMYLKNFSVAKRYDLLQIIYNIYYDTYTKGDLKNQKLLNTLMGIGNSKKAYEGMHNALQNNKLFKLKEELESFVSKKIFEDAILGKKYGHVLENIKVIFEEFSKIGNEFETLQNLRRNQVIYWDVPLKVIKYIEQMNLPDSLRDTKFKNEGLAKFKEELLTVDLENDLQKKLFIGIVDYLKRNLGDNHYLFENLSNNNNLALSIINNSFMSNKIKYENFLNSKQSNIKEINDPLIILLSRFQAKLQELDNKAKELDATIENLNRLYSEMLFAVFGEDISPDATATLRITDGTIKGYEYNGTIAPPKTTYYGMYDRYFSFGGNIYPWGLPNNWLLKKDSVNLSTPLNFASTHDIVGGNSGSAAINVNKEVIGLIFDGNYESLAGFYYYDPTVNRAVGIDSKGLIEALKNIYNTKNLIDELVNGKR